MAETICKTCKYWERIAPDVDTGRCRRHPRTDSVRLYNHTTSVSWCGEWVAKGESFQTPSDHLGLKG
jgi:hypothetical protein